MKSKNIEFFLYFSDISDIREKIRDIPNIEAFYGKNDVSRNIENLSEKKCCYLEKVNINVKYDVNITCTDSTSLSSGTSLLGTSPVEVFTTY